MADSHPDYRGGVWTVISCVCDCYVWFVCEGCCHPDGRTDGRDYTNVFRITNGCWYWYVPQWLGQSRSTTGLWIHVQSLRYGYMFFILVLLYDVSRCWYHTDVYSVSISCAKTETSDCRLQAMKQTTFSADAVICVFFVWCWRQ